MSKYIEDEGTGFERIVLIGEAGGALEGRLGKPFVGKSGSTLQRWWNRVGLYREQMYITNVYPYTPPGNNLNLIPSEELEYWKNQLHERLSRLHDPYVIVPTGNTALYALTGKKGGITKLRGSIYGYTDLNGREIKVIPTVHPAATESFRQPELERACIKDWERIAEDSTFRELNVPERQCFVDPTLGQVHQFLEEAAKFERMAVDIETIRKTATVRAIGFCVDPEWAFCIPWGTTYWGQQWFAVQKLIQNICSLPNEKVLQNGLFDSYALAVNDVRLTNFVWDTLGLHHCLDCLDYSHALEYMASVDTRQPYWKDMEHDKEVIAEWGSKQRAMQAYCCIDNCVTLELGNLYIERVIEQGKMLFYDNHYKRMIAALLPMMLHGVRMDQGYEAELHDFYELQRDVKRARLMVLAGEDLIAEKDFSPIKLRKFIYETMKMPKQYSTKNKKKSLNTDVFAIKKLINLRPEFEEAGQLILDFRRSRKLATETDGHYADKDGYVRCQYRFTTDSGRLASRTNPTGTGRNLQNVDHEHKKLYIPDPDHIFVEVDLSQAENRDVNTRTGNPELVEMAHRKPWEWDEHRFYGSVIHGGIPEEEVTDKQRYLGKRANHGYSYGATELMLMDQLLKDGFVFTKDEVRTFLDAIGERFPAKKHWQQYVDLLVVGERRLWNVYGREYNYEYHPINAKTFREAYSHQPQGDIGDHLNQKGVLPFQEEFANPDAILCAQVHDSMLISCRPEVAWDVIEFLKPRLETPITVPSGGFRVITEVHSMEDGEETQVEKIELDPAGPRMVELSIPMGVTIGTNWEGYHEFKKYPTKDELEAKIKEMLHGS